MATQADLHKIAILIDGERALMRRFVDVLEHEESLLVAGETDALLALVREKSEIYQLLQRQHDGRALLLGRLRLGNNDAAVRSLCASMPDTLLRWEEVLALAREARERNSLNGKLIIERMHNNQAALSVLLSATDQPQLYGADGSTRPTGGGRHLGSA
ncbi:MAG: flagellar protein FlgN [Zoogloeaceae bacterium]|nr:flagellar protein FlgN [Zoogloeaceae bacterium]